MRRSLAICLPIAIAVALTSSAQAQTLEGFASLPADTFAPGPTSGQFIAPPNGRTPPFVDKQPVQGFSSILRTSRGEFLAMSDNGFGAKGNSADYVLRFYRIAPDFRTKRHGSARIDVKSFVTLSDPLHLVNFSIVADAATYPNSSIPVDPRIRQGRLLTGGDFDIESFREAHDGTLWFGEEFGPFLIHTDATGRVVERPYPMPNVQSPQNPFLGSAAPTLGGSRGFEGMAISPNGRTLYPMLEGALLADSNQRRLIISEFDLAIRQYTGKQWWYRLDADSTSGQAIGDFTAVDAKSFLVIERDGGQGPTAAFKKIFLVNLDDVDASGFLVKREVADLLNISDPDDVSRLGNPFRFPFVTIESVIPLDNHRLGVLNDNNYPFSAGRTANQPDNNEFIIIKLDEPLLDRHGKDHHDKDDDR